jgi:hypothetical protein
VEILREGKRRDESIERAKEREFDVVIYMERESKREYFPTYQTRDLSKAPNASVVRK